MSDRSIHLPVHNHLLALVHETVASLSVSCLRSLQCFHFLVHKSCNMCSRDSFFFSNALNFTFCFSLFVYLFASFHFLFASPRSPWGCVMPFGFALFDRTIVLLLCMKRSVIPMSYTSVLFLSSFFSFPFSPTFLSSSFTPFVGTEGTVSNHAPSTHAQTHTDWRELFRFEQALTYTRIVPWHQLTGHVISLGNCNWMGKVWNICNGNTFG